MEQGMEEEEYQEYKQEDIHKLAIWNNRLSENEQGTLLKEIIKDDLDF